MAEALGTSTGNVSNRIKRLLTVTHDLKGEKTFYTNRIISLNVRGSDRPVQFYPFAVFNHLAHRISTKQALLMVNYIQQSYNKIINKDNKLISPSTQIFGLKNIYYLLTVIPQIEKHMKRL